MVRAEVMSPTKETEVTEKAKRRTFTVEYKRRIVKDADACRGSAGGIALPGLCRGGASVLLEVPAFCWSVLLEFA
jgi:hypothetical protein